MSRITLYTYEDIQQFNNTYKKLEEEGKRIYPFLFKEDEIERLLELEEEGDKVLDISALIENIQAVPGNKILAIPSLRNIDDSFQVMVRADLAELASNSFPTIFSNVVPLDGRAKKGGSQKDVTIRRFLYTYENGDQLGKIIEFAEKNHIPFASSSTILSLDNKEFKELSTKQKKSIIDVTSLIQATTNNPQLIFHAEQILGFFPYFDAIVRAEFAEQAINTFRFLFCSTKPIHDLYTEIPLSTGYEKEPEIDKVVRVIDLTRDKREALFNALNTDLIGHIEFKERFVTAVENFVDLNKLKERKVLSMFLLGGSGLGKTEVPQILNRTINNVSPLAKINFGNYSSKDSLNSLIGSPRGYIGSEEGELSVKIRRSKVGVLLCDEFEKATRQIFDFFLELLEDGHFTDSIAREFDLDGYIIVFTGNITEKQFYDQIPPELQSRFDLVCLFTPLTRTEKIEYVEYQVKRILERLDSSVFDRFSKDDLDYFRTVDANSTDNLRDIKRMIQERVISRMRNTNDLQTA